MFLLHRKLLISSKEEIPDEKEISEELVFGYWVFYGCLFLEWLMIVSLHDFLTKRRTYT